MSRRVTGQRVTSPHSRELGCQGCSDTGLLEGGQVSAFRAQHGPRHKDIEGQTPCELTHPPSQGWAGSRHHLERCILSSRLEGQGAIRQARSNPHMRSADHLIPLCLKFLIYRTEHG